MKNNLRKSLLAMMLLAVMTAVAGSASAQTVKSAIQSMTGWQHCDACAGNNASGPAARVTMAQHQTSPSMTGNSTSYTIASGTPYADGLWWKQLGAVNTATNLVYDLYFYIKTPQYSQALEFDANQANGNHRWVFGTQCNIAAGVWDIWANAAGKWTSTGIHCSAPTAFAWHHLTWEFKRSGNYVTFVAFTYDGVKHYLNKTYPAKTSGSQELNVAFQMDMKANHVTYSTWLDQVSLKYW